MFSDDRVQAMDAPWVIPLLIILLTNNHAKYMIHDEVKLAYSRFQSGQDPWHLHWDGPSVSGSDM
jgi:hypothetical protein